MGKASISIAVSGSYNGAALQRAEKQLDRLAVRTSAAEGSMSKSWSEAGSKAAEAGGKIYNTGQKVADAGDQLSVGVTAPLVAVGAASFKTATDFESSMSRVSGALNDPSADMEGLRQLAIDMGADTVFSASEAGAAMEELAKGGLTEADIRSGALKTTMDLAAAGGLDLAEAANTTVQAMGAFGLNADQAGQAANALAGAAAASSADVSDLTQGLSQASAQANSAGWSIQDTSAVLAAFADAGIKGSDAGTSLKTMLQRLSAPTDQAAALMQDLGINVRDADGQLLDATGIAGELSGKLSTLDSATRDAALQTIFGADASRAALVMMNQGSEGIRRYTAATNDQTAAQRLADSQMGDTERSIEEMNGAVESASIQLGGALAPAVTDAANAVGAAAKAFSGLDSGTQSAIIGFGAVAAASGPVLSISGRIVKGIGGIAAAYGKVKQSVAVYADAMTTTNVKSLEAYRSNDKLAKALAKNPAAKAAGGVDKYVDAVRRANSETAKYNSAVRQYDREVKKGSKANSELVQSLGKEVDERKKAMDAAKGTVDGYKKTAAAATSSSAAVTASSVAMKAAAVAGKALRAALITIAPVAVITAISAIASNLKAVEERERQTKAATDGLVAATNQGVSAANAGADALTAFGQSASDAKAGIDGVMESQAALAKTISETNTSASAQMAQLDAAYATIQQYANHSDLSAEAQGRLKTAVDTVNNLCGTQVKVTDLANGKLADENGAITDVTESLGDYINKKMDQIRIDAQQQNLTALYQQQAKDIEALALAQKDYNQRLDELGGKQEFVSNFMSSYSGATRQQAEDAWAAQEAVAAQESGLNDARAAYESCNMAISNVSSSLTSQAYAADGASLSLQSIVSASPVITGAMNAMGTDVNGFANDLSDAGLSVETFRSLNDDQLFQLATSWDGTTQSIVSALDGMGIAMGDSGLSAASALANGLASGRIDVDTATSILKTAAEGDWSSVATKMYNAGINLPENIAAGISANGYKPTSATSSMMSMVALILANGNVPAAAKLLGHDIDSGLAQGIAEGTLSEAQADLLGDDVIAKAKESLESHSPSVAFYRIGLDVDAGLANGISGGSESPLSSMFQLGQSLVQRISGAPAEARRVGSNASRSMSNGIASGAGSVANSAQNLARNASNGVSGTPSSLSNAGYNASHGFASGIGSGIGATQSNANSLASAASGMRDTGNPYTWGSHLAANFANGISAGINWVADAAWNIAQAARDAIGFSVPKKGPWSGAEKGGETSGRHLAQNFARGMMSGCSYVEDASNALASSASFSAGYQPARNGAGNVYVDMTEVLELLRIIASKDATVQLSVNSVSTALASAAKTTRNGRGYR